MEVLGVLLALSSALVWGGGDFIGGLAARRSSHLHVLALSAFSGVVMLVTSALLWREPIVASRDLMWAIPAGLSGAVGIANLYRGLSLGNAAIVAPIAAVIGAAVPVIVGVLTESWPPLTQTLGCGVAMLGIWFVTSAARTSPASQTPSTEGVRRAMLAGTGFGGFFVFMAQTSDDAIFLPLAVSRAIGVVAAILLITARRMRLPSLTSSPMALVAGLFDASGGLFFVLAKEWTRFDVAAVLSSLYPVSTVLLARIVQSERITPMQWMGVALCLVAVGLMTI